MKRVPAIMTADQATITAADRPFTLVAEDSPTITVITAVTMAAITAAAITN